jgi:hypothetical protein
VDAARLGEKRKKGYKAKELEWARLLFYSVSPHLVYSVLAHLPVHCYGLFLI